MNLFRRWIDVDGRFEVSKDRRSEWIVFATTQEVEEEVFKLSDECGKLMVLKNQKQRFVSLEGEWWAELGQKMAPGLIIPGDESGHFRDCIVEPAKRSIELLISMGYDPTKSTPQFSIGNHLERESILQLALDSYYTRVGFTTWPAKAVELGESRETANAFISEVKRFAIRTEQEHKLDNKKKPGRPRKKEI